MHFLLEESDITVQLYHIVDTTASFLMLLYFSYSLFLYWNRNRSCYLWNISISIGEALLNEIFLRLLMALGREKKMSFQVLEQNMKDICNSLKRLELLLSGDHEMI